MVRKEGWRGWRDRKIQVGRQIERQGWKDENQYDMVPQPGKNETNKNRKHRLKRLH